MASAGPGTQGATSWRPGISHPPQERRPGRCPWSWSPPAPCHAVPVVAIGGRPGPRRTPQVCFRALLFFFKGAFISL